jgi:hypothetical protein
MSEFTSLKDKPAPRDGNWIVFVDLGEDGQIHLAHTDVVVVELDVWYIYGETEPETVGGYTHWKYLKDDRNE